MSQAAEIARDDERIGACPGAGKAENRMARNINGMQRAQPKAGPARAARSTIAKGRKA